MKRKFSKIVCIYTDDKNYVPARFNCPDLTIDDVVLNLTTNAEENFNKTYECDRKFHSDYIYYKDGKRQYNKLAYCKMKNQNI